ncbi:hypothetical protein JB92DRAFT_2837593 [Gautieria morchelliformis]|nr:hypothetical protein JB92DRAFT_2837593 [Gautieria morchelliformis]
MLSSRVNAVHKRHCTGFIRHNLPSPDLNIRHDAVNVWYLNHYATVGWNAHGYATWFIKGYARSSVLDWTGLGIPQIPSANYRSLAWCFIEHFRSPYVRGVPIYRTFVGRGATGMLALWPIICGAGDDVLATEQTRLWHPVQQTYMSANEMLLPAEGREI